MELTNKKLLLPLKCGLNTNLFPDLAKWIGYLASAVNVVLSKLFVGHSTGIKTSLFLLSICTDDLLSAPYIMTFFSILPSVNENSERELNPMK